MMDVKFQLALFDEQDDENMILLEDYLRLRKAGKIAWDPSLESSLLSLVCQGREWLLNYWNTGQVNLIILQLEAAIKRLEGGKEAIVRIAPIDSVGGPYLLFTPADEDIEISLFLIKDRRYYLDFPIEDVLGSAAELYAHVDEEREDLLRPAQGIAKYKYFKRLMCPGKELLAEMKRSAQSGRELYACLGKTVDREIYT